MAKKAAASSRHERFVQVSAVDIKAWAKTPEFKAMAKRARAIPGPTEADLREMPEITDEEWAAIKEARRKQSVTVRIDGDIVAWLKSKEGKYQQHLNRLLRFAMQREQAKAAKRPQAS